MNPICDIASVFKKKSLALIPYLTAGYPDFATMEKMVLNLEKAGVSLLELGIPFSDMSADGPKIQDAAKKALENGFKLSNLFQTLERLRSLGFRLPVVLFGYLNPFFRFGFESLALKCSKVGVRGILILDLPIEGALQLHSFFKSHGIDLIFLITPTTSQKRIQKINQLGSGFIYVVSRLGVTGKKTKIDQSFLEKYLKKIRKSVSKHHPLVLGFGLSQPKQIQALGDLCQGVVVGSALISKIEESQNKKPDRTVDNLIDYLSLLSSSIQKPDE